MIEVTFVAFAFVVALLFLWTESAVAVTITCFGGWLLLPVGNFPPGSADAAFPYWLTGTALPSDMLLTKMWWPPILALAGALWTDRQAFIRLRPHWSDVPLLMFCLWPIFQWPFVSQPHPSPWIAALYLCAAWGVPWCLGRAYFRGHEGELRLLKAFIWGLVVIAPVAVIEGVWGPQVYGWFYGPHPFRLDGIDRYIGYRPLGFFEDGNQYGIWVAATALSSIAFWQSEGARQTRALHGAIAAMALIIALMSQSTGAILLLLFGLALLWMRGTFVLMWTLRVTVLIGVVGGVAFLSGRLPLRHMAEDTNAGREIVHIIRQTGRGSVLWRLARDQDALKLVREHLVLGTGQWDWWRPTGQRPWDLATLLLGQLGAIGLIFAFGSLLIPAIGSLRSSRLQLLEDSLPRSALAIVVLIGAADMLFNSFILYPVMLAAGALVPVKICGAIDKA